MTRNRYYIENYGQKFEPIDEVLKYVAKNYCYDKVNMVIANDEFKDNLVGIKLIPNANTNILEFDNCSCEIITLNKLLKSHHLLSTIVISTWLDSENIFDIEEITGIKTVIGIPWHEESLELWSTTFGPFNIKNQERLEYKTISNPDLKRRFDNLTIKQINWSSMNSDDERTIKNLIKNYQDDVDPIEIFAYLRREKNLNYKRCKEFRQWTKNLINGKCVRIN